MIRNFLIGVAVCGVASIVAFSAMSSPNRDASAFYTSLSEPPSFVAAELPQVQDDSVAIGPGAPPAGLRRAVNERFSDSAYQKHIKELKKKLPHDDFHIVIQKPFVVIGDEAPEAVKRRAEGTVMWAVELLKKDYFNQDPEEIIDIWLFKDKDSYEQHNKQLFGSVPSTPFGFYSSTNKALVMNISTGGGTLVHEIVHPFIESNFPDCPSWFNEGLASLYEQCGNKDNKIWGHTNWRLRGLQGVVKSGRLGSFEDLCSTTTREFYNDERGTNYAQARYLCYYLQEKKLLREYYAQFKDGVNKDKSGYKTLVEILGRPDMEQFNRDWQEYVLRLTF